MINAASGIAALAAQKKTPELARQHDREVWFDLHVNTDGSRPPPTIPTATGKTARL
jgi:hypothetical protein